MVDRSIGGASDKYLGARLVEFPRPALRPDRPGMVDTYVRTRGTSIEI